MYVNEDRIDKLELYREYSLIGDSERIPIDRSQRLHVRVSGVHTARSRHRGRSTAIGEGAPDRALTVCFNVESMSFRH